MPIILCCFDSAYFVHLLSETYERLFEILKLPVLLFYPRHLLSQFLQVFLPQIIPLDPINFSNVTVDRPLRSSCWILLEKVVQTDVFLHVAGRLIRQGVERRNHHLVQNRTQIRLDVVLVLSLNSSSFADFSIPLLFVLFVSYDLALSFLDLHLAA